MASRSLRKPFLSHKADKSLLFKKFLKDSHTFQRDRESTYNIKFSKVNVLTKSEEKEISSLIFNKGN